MKINRNTAVAALVSLALAMPLVANAQKASTAAATPTKTTSVMAAKITAMNVNTATAAQLETLPGIGPKIAAEIVKNRPYKDGKELQAKVNGIGPKVWKEIKKYVLFK